MAGYTCDDDVKELQPVRVAAVASTPRQQEVHDHMSVVPQAVGGQKQAPPAPAQALQQLQQPGILSIQQSLCQHMPQDLVTHTTLLCQRQLSWHANGVLV